MVGLGLVLPLLVGLTGEPLTILRFILPLPLIWLGVRRTFRMMRATWSERVAMTDGPIFLLSLLLLGLAFVISYPIVRVAGDLSGDDVAAISVFPADVLLLWAGALFLVDVAKDEA